MRLLLLLMLCVSLPVYILAQGLNPSTVFEAGGTESDQVRAIVHDPITDHRYVVSRTLSDDGAINGAKGNWDAWVLKLDANNDTLWTKIYGGTGADIPLDAMLDNGDLVVVGRTTSEDGDLTTNKGSEDGWIFKLNSAGDLLWSTSYGGANPDKFMAITDHKSGGYVVVGSSSSVLDDLPLRDVSTTSAAIGWVTHIDTAGNLLSSDYVSATTDNDYLDEMVDVITMPDGYYTVGSTGHFILLETEDIWVVKLNNQLTASSEAFLGGSAAEYAKSIHRVPGTFEFIITAETQSNDGPILGSSGSYDYWAARLVGSGNTFSIVSSNAIGGTDADVLRAAAADDSTVYLFGMSRSTNGDRLNADPANGNDAWLVAIDYDCNVRYQTSFGGTDSDYGIALTPGNCGELILGIEMESADGDATVNAGADDVWVGSFGNTATATFLTDNFKEGDTGELEIQLAHPVLGNALTVSATAEAGATSGAVPNLDYPPLEANASIATGESSVVVEFPTNRDADIEGPENVLLKYTVGPIVACPAVEGELSVTLEEGPLSRHDLQIDGLEIGPNPTANKLTLTRAGNTALTYEIMNANGQTLHTQEWQSGTLQIDLGAYANGLYLLRLSDSSASVSYRIVKQ